ncbi:glycosyltransferase family 2 protein [Acidobacteria bacterium AH-259-A15]|nr:glycosyltransferase family 2 protein [Acidobacteria bacterium AH-259-A15]
MGITVVIPAYNEEGGLGTVLESLCRLMREYELLQEIIVVDDASRDSTAEIANRYEKVIVLRHRANRGYGAALRTGIRHAQHDLICITDADGTYPHDRIPDLVDLMMQQGWDMVIGARTGERVSIPLLRRPPKWVLGKLASFIASEPISDLNSGLRIFRKEAALRLFNMLPDGFSFTTTITLAMLTSGYLVGYAPINYYARIGRSKIRPIRDTLYFFRLVLRMALYFAPLKVFLSLSLIMLLLAISWALYSRFVLGQLADVSTLIIASIGIQAAMLGMLAELINRRLPNDYRRE